MRTQIPPSHYSSPDVHELEKEKISRNCWNYFCLTMDLPNDKDYIVRDVFGESVFVQNFKGKLKAFSNVCPHRFNQLHCKEKGNASIICSYHGWSFNSEGVAIGIPRKSEFSELCGENARAARLKTWELEICGRFIFIRFGDQGTDLRAYLGKFFGELEAISNAMSEEAGDNRQNIDSNWKICVENTLENYHVDLIHPSSFKKLGASGAEFEFEGPHSAWNGYLNEKTMAGWKKMASAFGSRPYQIDHYRHLFIFPNLTVATTYGASFSIQSFSSFGGGTTAFRSRVFMTILSEQKEMSSPFVQFMKSGVPEFNDCVFAEDKTICEQVHRGTLSATEAGYLCETEQRVAHFQAHYMSALIASPVPQRGISHATL